MHFCCRAPYGARGLKLSYLDQILEHLGRAPYGARGLKCAPEIWRHRAIHASRSVWGAWIEMLCLPILLVISLRRAPYGARGLKLAFAAVAITLSIVALRMGRVD